MIHSLRLIDAILSITEKWDHDEHDHR